MVRPRLGAAALTCRVDQRDQPARLDDLSNALPLSSRQVDARRVVGARVQPDVSRTAAAVRVVWAGAGGGSRQTSMIETEAGTQVGQEMR